MRLREPFNAWSHLVGLLLAAGGTLLLLRLANRTSETVAFGIYGATLILLYGASSVYHALRVSPARLRRLRTLDHIAIYFLIAGTYTPVALLTLDDVRGWLLLGSVWAVAGAGIPFKIRYLDAPVWLSTATYLAMGHLALLAAGPIVRQVGPGGLAWLVAGGVAYTVGAIIFTRERPDPLPDRLGFHGLWHLLVLLGSACHYAFMIFHVLPG
ncbi:MAG TPA: hemolysin III family protein [Gemmatimonadales bacterium]|nr:hemolysin III family protein [Gemmatimonadales bacterium]